MEEILRKLQEVAWEGNITSLVQLLEEDKLVLERYSAGCFPETPLHVAAMLGHLEFTREILSRRPEFAKELDFHGSSPLHLAVANGRLEVVKTLLLIDPGMCFAQDKNGWSPLHIAVIKGRVEVLKELVQSKPEAAQLRGEKGETILHLCVEHCQLGALKLLVETITAHEFINSKDRDGLTILHTAVADREVQITNFLITKTTIELNALNGYGFTALDIALAQGRRNLKDIDIQDFLRKAGAVSSREIFVRGYELEATRSFSAARIDHTTIFHSLANNSQKHHCRKNHWLEAKRNSLMVVASLLATMAFQAGISPPTGIWQDESQQSKSGSHEAGCSIMAEKFPHVYARFVVFNTTSFLTSLIVILTLISGLPVKRKFFTWFLMVIMWIAITSTITTYSISIKRLSCGDQKYTGFNVGVGIVMWGVVCFILVGHYVRLGCKIAKFAGRLIGQK